jgi:phospholipid transport system substrate-binding protein
MQYVVMLTWFLGTASGAVMADERPIELGEAALQTTPNAVVKAERLSGEVAAVVGTASVPSAKVGVLNAPVKAVSTDVDPFQQVDQVTVALVDTISQYRGGFPANEQVFFAQITAILEPHVDFSNMAKNVMGPYDKIASTQQRRGFSEAFQLGLIETYGRGLMSFNNEKIIVINRRPLKEAQRKIIIKQEIHGADKVYPLSYTVRRKKTGRWMITNVVINGINLGKTLRNQFIQSAKKNAGDIDVVIAKWSTASA